MVLKLSIFTTVTNPIERGDTWSPAIRDYYPLADEIIVMNGGMATDKRYDKKMKFIAYYWPKEFNWPFIGEQFTRGYEACTGDWVIHLDLDMLFHEENFNKIREVLHSFSDSPGISFHKRQFTLPDRYNIKSRLVLAVNKGKFGNRIRFNGGGDLCQPTLDGKLLRIEKLPQSGIAVWNYEKIIKTKEQIMDDQGRMERAYKRHFEHYQLAENASDISAYEGWLKMQTYRFNKPSEKIPLHKHPKYIQDTIRNLTPGMWGYNGFGLLKDRVYA